MPTSKLRNSLPQNFATASLKTSQQPPSKYEKGTTSRMVPINYGAERHNFQWILSESLRISMDPYIIPDAFGDIRLKSGNSRILLAEVP